MSHQHQQNKFLNARLGQKTKRIDTTEIKDLSDLRKEIKAEFGDDIPYSAEIIRLYKSRSNGTNEKESNFDNLVIHLNEISEEYHESVDEGGLVLVIRTVTTPDEKSSMRKMIPFPPNSVGFFEGLPEVNQLRLCRVSLVNKIADALMKHKSLLITMPIFGGKTSLANLVYNHLQQQGKTVYYISFSRIWDYPDLYAYIYQRVHLHISEVLETDCYLIMDDVDFIYNRSDFWDSFNSETRVCKVLAFGVHVLSFIGTNRSPPQFQLKWNYEDVKLTEEECWQLVELFRQWVPRKADLLTPEVLGNLFGFLNYNPSLVFVALHIISREFTRRPLNAENASDIMKLFVTGEFRKMIYSHSRCFSIGYSELKEFLGDDTRQILETLISSDTTPLNDEKLVGLVKLGVCITDRKEETLLFSSEIMRYFCRDLLYAEFYGGFGPRSPFA
ncbi:hypothetical protein MP638_006398 [Amoeboaphelidium occidentale]|nr:hypothetical protein MP638_006398 [Amoeboaphelidium occidentale]